MWLGLEEVQIDLAYHCTGCRVAPHTDTWACANRHAQNMWRQTYEGNLHNEILSLCKPPLQLSVHVNNRFKVCMLDLDTGWHALVPHHLLQWCKFTQDISHEAQMGWNQAILWICMCVCADMDPGRGWQSTHFNSLLTLLWPLTFPSALQKPVCVFCPAEAVMCVWGGQNRPVYEGEHRNVSGIDLPN